MKSFVISLRDTERHKDSRKYFDEYGLEVTWWWGVDARRWGIHTYHLRNGPDRDYVIHPGQVGCSLSHWSLWQHIANSSEEPVLVFEDDAVFEHDRDEFLRRLDAEVAGLPAGWNFLHLDRYSGELDGRMAAMGTHAYLLHKEAAVILLTNCDTNSHNIDVQIHRQAAKKLGFYVVGEPLVKQRTTQGLWPTLGG